MVDFVKDEVYAYLETVNGDPLMIRTLIKLLVGFKIISDDDVECLLLKPLEERFNHRNERVDDQGLWIYNVQNRKDALRGIISLISFLGKEAFLPYIEDVVPTLLWALLDTQLSVKLAACTSLKVTVLTMEDEFIGAYFEPTFQFLLKSYAKHIDEINLRIAFRELDDLLKLMLKKSGRFRLDDRFIQQFNKHVNNPSPHVRNFLLNWIAFLYGDGMLRFLLVFLDGLFNMFIVPLPQFPAEHYVRNRNLFNESRYRIQRLLSRFRQTVSTKTNQYIFDVGKILSIVTRQLNHNYTRVEALNWMSMMINKYPCEVLRCPEFKICLDASLPEAHYLEGVRIASRGTDFKDARTHLYKALNHVKESTLAIAMLTIFLGEKELTDFFSSMLYTQPWEEVVTTWDSLRATSILVRTLEPNPHSTTLVFEMPGCAQMHKIESKCKDCYVYLCSKEFCSLFSSSV
ncbi:unnamed protein product [Arabidopsis halleri]